MSDPNVPRQPIFNVPAVLVAVIVALVAIQAIRDCLPDDLDLTLFNQFAFVPARLTAAFDPTAVQGALGRLAGGGQDAAERLAVARFFLGDGSVRPWTLLTYALLHANWPHLWMNALWLLAFGAPVARRFGPGRFLIFLAGGALAGVLTHCALFPLAFEPLVGASAAVSACMGAALRFMVRPSSRAVAPTSEQESAPPRPEEPISFLMLLKQRRVLAFVAIWLITNFVSGLPSVASALAGGPIAWQAHIGGFVFGLFGFPLFVRKGRGATPLPDAPPASE